MAFDPAAATAAYIAASVRGTREAPIYRAAANGLLLLGLVVSAIVTFIFVRFGILDRLAAKLERRGWAMQTFLLSAAFMLLSALITLPWHIYAGWWRETAYGRTSQPLGDSLGQDAISLLLGALFAAFSPRIYA